MTRLSALIVVMCLLVPAAYAQDGAPVRSGNTTIQNGATIRELPGNAYIVDGGGGSGVTIRGNESILYRTLVHPYQERHFYNNAPVGQGSASINDVQSICGNETKISDRNECVADVIKEREKLQRRYNN